MRVPALGLALCLACVAALAAPSQSQKPVAHPAAPPKQPPGDATVPLLTDALRLSDFPGMAPIPGLRDKLSHVTGFTQATPNDGKPGTEATEVWFGYTKTTLYFVFICRDRRVTGLRGHLARRENILTDDNVSVVLDPFQDRRKGVLFTVNPAGVQADAAWTENSDPNYSYDQVWDSEGVVTSDGWMALVAIPFRSLRFRAAGSDWGVVFMRNLPRNSEVDFWPIVSAKVSGVLSQEGTLHGIQSVTGSHNLQLNPYALGQNERTLQNLDPLNPFFSSRRMEGTAGGEVKLIVKDRIVLDATFNPDFSDVESDEPQFTVNQRYSVYFPELRPFFLENANYFSTPIRLLYTRNIVHPEYGVRVTGKIGRTNLGLLAVDDRAPGEMVAPGDTLYNHRATFAVGRVSQDLGKGSSIGAIYTDKEFGGGWNRIGGLDFTWRFTENWTALGQMVESSTKGSGDGGSPATYAAGPASYLEFQRTGHALNLDTTIKNYSSGFQSQVGFIQTTNIYTDQTHASYQWYPKHSPIQSFGLEATQNIAFDHQYNRIYRYTTADPFFLLARNFVVAPLLGLNSDTLGPQDGTLFEHNHNFTENFGGLVLRGAPLAQLSLNLVAIHGGNVNYNPVAGQVPSLMHEEFVQSTITLQPLRQLTADNTYLLDRDHSAANRALVYESQTFRTKINFQFTRSFSARVIAQYDSTLSNPAETSIPRRKQIGTQALFTWLPHPGTAIYAGYNNDLQNLDRSLCNRLLSGSCDPNNIDPPRSPQYLNDGRQFFIKASYLLRF